jgi:hypothetical protein
MTKPCGNVDELQTGSAGSRNISADAKLVSLTDRTITTTAPQKTTSGKPPAALFTEDAKSSKFTDDFDFYEMVANKH